MRKKTKSVALSVLAGSMMLGIFGCLDFGFLNFRQIGTGLAVEFLTDNDAIFDLFEDGEPTPEADTTG